MWPSAIHNWPDSKTFYFIPGLRQFSFLNFMKLFAALTIKHNLNLSSPSIYCQHSIARRTHHFSFLVSSFLEYFRRGLNGYVMPPRPPSSPKIGLAIQGIHNTNQSNYSGLKQYSNPAFPPLTVAISPVVIKTMAHFLINCRHGLHVALPPISP